MALSVVQRPKGFIVSTTSATGTYTNGSSVITKTGHGLITGATIYISTGQAIGFYYVNPLTVDTFNIREYAGATVYTFVGSGTFTYSTSTDNAGHGWNAVHLPIEYKLLSTLWPTNSVDTARIVSSYANDNGYVKLTLSGDLKSDVTELEFVKVTFTGGTSAICQILTWYSNSIVTINLAYIGGITFTSVQYYYNNYRAQIRVYGGLTSGHYFNSQKPFTLITEQSIVPDSDGLCIISINEFLKQQIEILKNDLTKGTLQNNLDAFCQFYITYAEAYDYSAGGYTILDYVGSYSDDSELFTGVAVNADLPFKNTYSGFMSDYLYGNSAVKLKFLTPSLYPELTEGQFFDISFINQIGARLRMKREMYRGDAGVVELLFDEINDYGIGIYRYELSRSATNLEDRIDLTLQYHDYSDWVSISETKTIAVNDEPCDNYINISWLNQVGGFDYWTFVSDSDYGAEIDSAKSVNVNISTNWPKSYGAGADTIRKETSRTSRQFVTVRAENLSEEQVADLYRIRLSPLVQIVNSRNDRRTIIPDGGSFTYLQQREKMFEIVFRFEYTDNFPVQSL